jgi:hypothetical protein
MANEWANWPVGHQIVYSASSDESIATLTQKVIAETDRIYSLLARLRQHDAGTGTALDDSVPYQFKIDTLTDKILIRNVDNSAWIMLGSVSKYFGITPAQISAVATKGGITSIAVGNDADKPLATSSTQGDMYIGLDQKKVYLMGASDWELILSLNVQNLIGYETLVTLSQTATVAAAGKIPVANISGELEYSITGNAAKIANKAIDATNIADGRVLVYRDTTGGFVFESKGGTGTTGTSEIDDNTTSTGMTYSSTKIEKLLSQKSNITGSLTPYSVTYDDTGRIATVTINSVNYTITYDNSGRLESISNGTATVTAQYNKYGQYLGLGA